MKEFQSMVQVLHMFSGFELESGIIFFFIVEPNETIKA